MSGSAVSVLMDEIEGISASPTDADAMLALHTAIERVGPSVGVAIAEDFAIANLV